MVVDLRFLEIEDEVFADLVLCKLQEGALAFAGEGCHFLAPCLHVEKSAGIAEPHHGGEFLEEKSAGFVIGKEFTGRYPRSVTETGDFGSLFGWRSETLLQRLQNRIVLRHEVVRGYG